MAREMEGTGCDHHVSRGFPFPEWLRRIHGQFSVGPDLPNVIIYGIGHSGTSLLAGIAETLGWDFGDDVSRRSSKGSETPHLEFQPLRRLSRTEDRVPWDPERNFMACLYGAGRKNPETGKRGCGWLPHEILPEWWARPSYLNVWSPKLYEAIQQFPPSPWAIKDPAMVWYLPALERVLDLAVIGTTTRHPPILVRILRSSQTALLMSYAARGEMGGAPIPWLAQQEQTHYNSWKGPKVTFFLEDILKASRLIDPDRVEKPGGKDARHNIEVVISTKTGEVRFERRGGRPSYAGRCEEPSVESRGRGLEPGGQRGDCGAAGVSAA